MSCEEKHAHFVVNPGNNRSCAARVQHAWDDAELREGHNVDVDHRIIEHLHDARNLSVLRTTHRPGSSGVQQVITEAGNRANRVPHMERIGLSKVLSADFTELF